MLYAIRVALGVARNSFLQRRGAGVAEQARLESV